jgi:tetratricopeptide (TPR) repeat protein
MSAGDEPQAFTTLTDEGVALFNQGDYDGALKKLEQALALDQNYVRALGMKGSVLRMQDEPQKASEVLQRAAQLSPGSSWILAEWGEALRMQDRYEEALEILQRALDGDPDNAFALGTKGVVLLEQGRYKHSLQALEQALALDPDYAFALGVKGAVLAEMDRYEEALEVLASAPSEDPNYRYVLAVRAQILCDSAYYEYGLQDINHARRLGLDNMTTLILKGWALQNLNYAQVQESVDVYEEALRRQPSKTHEALLRTHYGRALSLLSEWEAAKTQYRGAIHQTSEQTGEPDALMLATLGWCYYGIGQYTEAVSLLNSASSLNKGLIFTQFDSALTLMCGGRRKHAFREYRLALQLAEGKHILRRRGLVHVALCDLQTALNQQSGLVGDSDVQRSAQLLQDARQQIERELSEENLHEILHSSRGMSLSRKLGKSGH